MGVIALEVNLWLITSALFQEYLANYLFFDNSQRTQNVCYNVIGVIAKLQEKAIIKNGVIALLRMGISAQKHNIWPDSQNKITWSTSHSCKNIYSFKFNKIICLKNMLVNQNINSST